MNSALTNLIRGRWRRHEEDVCDDDYPYEIEFLEDGVYLSHATGSDGFVQWGGGDYEIVSPDRIKLQIQTDEMVTYEIRGTQHELLFRDLKGYEFRYQRIG